MQVTSTQASQASQQNAAANQATKANTLDYDAFLQLLVAELKNQDPTKPMDSAQYIGQLASFSSVEQTTKLNVKLETLITAQALSQADSIIGRLITSADGSVSGVATGLKIVDGGAVALIEGGGEIPLGTGVTVTNP